VSLPTFELLQLIRRWAGNPPSGCRTASPDAGQTSKKRKGME
jgi:hypothetical protein